MVNEFFAEETQNPSQSNDEEDCSWTLVTGKKKKSCDRKRSKSVPSFSTAARTNRRGGVRRPRRSSVDSPNPNPRASPIAQPRPSPIKITVPRKYAGVVAALPSPGIEIKTFEEKTSSFGAPSMVKPRAKVYKPAEFKPSPSPKEMYKPLSFKSKSKPKPSPVSVPKPTPVQLKISAPKASKEVEAPANFPQVDKDGHFLTPPAVKRAAELLFDPKTKPVKKTVKSSRSDYKPPIHFSCSTLNPKAVPYSTPPLIADTKSADITPLLTGSTPLANPLLHQPVGYQTAQQYNVSAHTTPQLQPMSQVAQAQPTAHAVINGQAVAYPQQYINAMYYSPMVNPVTQASVVHPMTGQAMMYSPMVTAMSTPSVQPMSTPVNPMQQVVHPSVNPPPIQMTPSYYSPAPQAQVSGPVPHAMNLQQSGYSAPVHQNNSPSVLTLPFNSTTMGLQLDDYDYTKIGRVDPSGQGAMYGVAIGWKVTHVDNEAVHGGNIMTHLETADPSCFYLTFQIPTQNPQQIFYQTSFQTHQSKAPHQVKMEGLDALEEMYGARRTGRNSATTNSEAVSEATSYGSSWPQESQQGWYEPTNAPLPTAAPAGNPREWLM